MSPEEELIRAGHANDVLNSPIFIEARRRMDSTLAEQRRKVPLRDTEMHTRLILMEQLWGNLTDWLEQTAQTGKFAELQLAQKRKLFGI